MAYVKNIWVDQDVERPKTYEVTNNQDGSITLTDSFGLVTELGTPVNEVNMNHIEDGIAGCAIRKHNLTETFNLDEWVLGGTGDDEGIYKSLVANNVGNAITDDTKWEKVSMGGGSSHNIGEVVASTIPLTDAGLHLLDGSLISGSGSYSAFVTYIASLVSTYSSLFTTEATWQSTVSSTGICDKFVYDSVNNTVRLPKWGNQAYTKASSLSLASTVPVRGNGTTLGITDGTNNYGAGSGTTNWQLSLQASSYGTTVGTSLGNVGQYLGKTFGITTEGANSGIVANTSSVASLNQYPLNCYYYIVIATSTKTNIQVDIDEIATDLNGKADVDLTNLNSTGTSTVAKLPMPATNVAEQLTIGASGTTYTMTANGWIRFRGTSTSTNQRIALFSDTGISSTVPCPWNGSQNDCFIPVKKGDVVTLSYTTSITPVYLTFIKSVGEA